MSAGKLEAERRHVGAVGDADHRLDQRGGRMRRQRAQLGLGARRLADLQQRQRAPSGRCVEQTLRVARGEGIAVEVEGGVDAQRVAGEEAIEGARMLGGDAEPISEELRPAAAQLDARRPIGRGRGGRARDALGARDGLEMAACLAKAAEAPGGEPGLPLRRWREGGAMRGRAQQQRLLRLAGGEVAFGDDGAQLVEVIGVEQALGLGAAQRLLGAARIGEGEAADLFLQDVGALLFGRGQRFALQGCRGGARAARLVGELARQQGGDDRTRRRGGAGRPMFQRQRVDGFGARLVGVLRQPARQLGIARAPMRIEVALRLDGAEQQLVLEGGDLAIGGGPLLGALQAENAAIALRLAGGQHGREIGLPQQFRFRRE